MINDIKKLLDDYIHWLKDKTQIRQIENWVEITTPYLDRHNDYIQIYAKKENGKFILTDDGYTIEDLEQCGCKLSSQKRKDLLNVILNGFGVRLQKTALEIHATVENFSVCKHNIVQAILAVNDIFYVASPIVASLFYEDVESWLDLHEIRYTPKVKFTGKSGFDHLFDFVIPKSRNKPERILHTINHPKRDNAQSLAFAWVDTKEIRLVNSKAYVFLNDHETEITSPVTDALQNYNITPILWSNRDKMRDELAA
ncbi:MAG: hypothetical protein ACD_59C00110G0012 [uncultured bacterium]|nr:MAG: hypothetical protein ACD_59C00110G0012 [uncultured bacterium]